MRGVGDNVPRTQMRTGVFAAVLVLAMVVGSLPTYTVSVLAPFIIDDLDVTRTAVGSLGTIVLVVASAVAPRGGRLVDRFGGLAVLIVLFSFFAGGLTAMAAAPTFALLLVSTSVTGISLSLSNPVTNQLTARHIAAVRQGWVIGIKQSGAQLSAVVAGVVLPAAALAWGWRTAVIVLALLGPVGAALSMVVVPRNLAQSDGYVQRDKPLEPGLAVAAYVRRLTYFGFLMAGGGGMVVLFLPLYVYEQFQVSAGVAGLTAAIVGVVGAIARLLWGPIAGRFAALTLPLIVLSALALTAIILLLVSTTAGLWLVWPAIVLFGMSGSAWNTPAMLAIIRVVGPDHAGRSSGAVMRGLYTGGVISPIASGALVDLTGSYAAAWALALVALVGATLTAGQLHRWARANGVGSVKHD